VRLRGLLQQFTGGPRQLAGIDRHLPQHFRHDALVLLRERDQQVLRLEQRMV
jgi:hypothetical protein